MYSVRVLIVCLTWVSSYCELSAIRGIPWRHLLKLSSAELKSPLVVNSIPAVYIYFKFY